MRFLLELRAKRELGSSSMRRMSLFWVISLLWVRFGRSCATKKSNLERGGAFEDEDNGERQETTRNKRGRKESTM